jgi:hypothetical protein
MQDEVVSFQDVFLFYQEAIDKNRKIIGKFRPTGLIPKFIDDLEKKGIKISRSIFTPK